MTHINRKKKKIAKTMQKSLPKHFSATTTARQKFGPAPATSGKEVTWATVTVGHVKLLP